ncbi:MAG: hypothetical protein Phog2KO_09960 [Phototrophicaceae bacterium]
MDTQQRLDLEELHKAVGTRNQQQLQFLLKRLLQRMEYYIALAVPMERIREFLPIFEQEYPDETWVRQLLLMINNYGKAPENDIAEMALQHEFTTPGVGNFLKAVYDLTQSMQEKHTPEARIGFMTSAVVNSIMADLAYAWYSERDKAWNKVRENQYDPLTEDYTDEQATRIAYIFWTHADTIALDKKLWQSVADSIDYKLKRLEQSS